MWQDMMPWLGGGGLVWLLAVFHRSAIRAHDKRADEMRQLLDTEREITAELRGQLSLLLGSGGGRRRRSQPNEAGRA